MNPGISNKSSRTIVWRQISLKLIWPVSLGFLEKPCKTGKGVFQIPLRNSGRSSPLRIGNGASVRFRLPPPKSGSTPSQADQYPDTIRLTQTGHVEGAREWALSVSTLRREAAARVAFGPRYRVELHKTGQMLRYALCSTD